MHELRRTFRSLWRDKGFTTIAVAMLALGIGATTAIFSVVHSVLLTPLPYPNPNRLYLVNEIAPHLAAEYPILPVNARHVDDWRSTCAACESVGLFQGRGAPFALDGPPEHLDVLRVSHDFLPTLGVAPALGRAFLPQDDAPGAAPVVLVSDALWKRRFGADPSVVGSTITLGQDNVEVVGVLPPSFRFRIGTLAGDISPMAPSFDILQPLRLSYAEIRPAGNHNWGAIARLRPGTAAAVAEQQMNAALEEYNRQFGRETLARLTPLAQHITSEAAPGLWLLLGAVGAVMLIVCVNLGSLLLARSRKRAREAAIRRALGAGASQLFGWIVREGLVLGVAGGILGVTLAHWAVQGLLLLAPHDTPRLDEIGVSGAALCLAAALAIASGLATTLLPALRLSATPPQEAIRETQTTSSQSRSYAWGQNTLVAAEVALSACLLVISTLLVTSFFRLMAVEKGFDQDRILSFEASVAGAAEERKLFHEAVLRDLASRPGVTSAGLTTWLPLEGARWIDSVGTPGRQRSEDEEARANFRWVTEGFWTTMGVRLLEGRLTDASDANLDVAMISRSLARTLWPNESAVGKRIQRGGGEPKEVIGVVEDVRTSGLAGDPVPIVYLPFQDLAPGDAIYVLRTTADPAAFVQTARDAVAGVNPGVPIRNIRTIEQLVNESTAQQRFQTTLAGAFAGIALTLAALGVFGVVSYAVSRRTNEMGIRLALGASPGSVLALVVRESMQPALAGLIAGLAGAAALGGMLQGLLFDVRAFEPALYAAVAVAVTIVAVAACYAPARRAARVDPIKALKYE